MKRKEDSEEMFEMIGNDPQAWLEQARLLKTSAQVQYDVLREIQAAGGSPSERSTALLAHMQAYMMLIGFSFENPIKAILVSRIPSKTTRLELAKDLWDKRKGHLLLHLIPNDIVLSDQERDLLNRLQTFTVWAGRYPLPMQSQHYHNEQKLISLKANEHVAVQNLFFRLMSYVVDIEVDD
jgi:hypothetical protein